MLLKNGVSHSLLLASDVEYMLLVPKTRHQKHVGHQANSQPVAHLRSASPDPSSESAEQKPYRQLTDS